MKHDSAEGGFTLVELIFGATIAALMVTAIATLFLANLESVTLGKARSLALGLANEKMEALRDLPYDSLATQGGAIYPPGNIPDNENVTRNNYKFKVHTDINYVDDAFDGYITCPCASGPAAGKPKDLYPYDYKKAQITIYLTTPNNKEVAVLTTDIAGKAAETSTNTGILSITVLDADGSPVPNATVHITNPNPTPDVDITTTTDNAGLVIVPKLPPDSANRYQVTVSYGGYSTDGTIPDPPGAQVAVKLNPNVLVQQISSLTFAIDQLSTLYLHVVDTAGNPINGLNVTTTGAKKTKTNPNVFKYSAATATNATGDITLTGIEWDSYGFALPAGNYLVTASPYAPVALDPNASKTVTLVVGTSSSHPRISTADPITAPTGTTVSGFDVTGVNLGATTTVTLKKAGQTDIAGTSCTSSGGNTIRTCDFSLTGAATGAWDVVLSNSGGTASQTGGFVVSP